jgi:hypothetical protein
VEDGPHTTLVAAGQFYATLVSSIAAAGAEAEEVSLRLFTY